MARTVEPGFHWIQECGPDRLGSGAGGLETHVPQNAYLLDGDESLLFDTLSPAATDQILEEIDEALDGSLDYLVPSHPDVPHAGNTRAILDEHPEATLVAPEYGKAHDLYHLGDAKKVAEGDEIDLGGFVVEFHEASFPDSAIHVWMSERTTGTLFTVDWLGFPHTGDECHEFVDEMTDEGVETWRLVVLHDFVLFWLKYVDVERTNAEIDTLVESHDPSIVAPAHGQVIREEPKEHMLRMKEVVEQISHASS